MTSAGQDLNLLVPLRALLEEQNVTRAGQRVNMGQSSMSSALSRLRATFNDELLVRVGRDYELTPLARELLPQVQQTVPMIEQVLTNTEPAAPTEVRRTITIMATDYATMRLSGAFAQVLRDTDQMGVEVVPLPERPMESERDLMTHDFAITVPGIGIEGQFVDLMNDEYVCLVDEHHPGLQHGQLSLDAFVASPQAVAHFGKRHFTPADRRLRELGIDRTRPHVLTTGFLPLPAVIAGTDLVAVVPKVLADTLGPTSGTIGVPAPFGRVEINLKLWWHESHESDPVHVWFREQLIQAAARLID